MSIENTLYCDCTPVVDVAYEEGDSRTLCSAIVEGVAAATDVDPTDLPPLQDVVDLEAIDQLFVTPSGESETAVFISFAVDQWNVFVRADGLVRICDRTSVTGPKPVFEPSEVEQI